MKILPKNTMASFLRNFIFGVEDSLVSTVGLLSGIAVADVPRQTIFLTGVVLVIVEAFSMGVGSLLSESSADEYAGLRKQDTRSIIGGVIMFFSYFIAGMIPLSPYLFAPTAIAFHLSISASLCALFLLGFLSASRFGARIWRSGLRMLILGGIAIAVGVLAGTLLK